MPTDNTVPSALAPVSANPPRRRNFVPDSSLPTPEAAADAPAHPDPAAPDAAVVPPAPAASAAEVAPPVASSKSAKASKAAAASKSAANPAPEASEERVSKAYRIRPGVLKDWKEFIDTLPRHIKEQDVVEFMMTDFLKRKPKLPDHLLNPPTR
jgi:hypothetical protein